MYVIRVFRNKEGTDKYFQGFGPSLFGSIPKFDILDFAFKIQDETILSALIEKIRISDPEKREIDMVSWVRLMDELFGDGTI